MGRNPATDREALEEFHFGNEGASNALACYDRRPEFTRVA